MTQLRAGINLRPATERSAASAKFLREPKAPVALGDDLIRKDWMISRYTPELSLPNQELAGLRRSASKPKSRIKRVLNRLTGSLKRLRNRLSMRSLKSKAKKADRKLNADIEEAVRAAKSAENATEMTVDQINALSKQHYLPPGALRTKDTKYSLARKFSDKKYIGPEGEENRGRFMTPYNTVFP